MLALSLFNFVLLGVRIEYCFFIYCLMDDIYYFHGRIGSYLNILSIQEDIDTTSAWGGNVLWVRESIFSISLSGLMIQGYGATSGNMWCSKVKATSARRDDVLRVRPGIHLRYFHVRGWCSKGTGKNLRYFGTRGWCSKGMGKNLPTSAQGGDVLRVGYTFTLLPHKGVMF